MKILLPILFLTLVLFSGCSEDESPIRTNSLIWQRTAFSLPSNLTFSASRFSKGEDEKLYVFGYGYDHSTTEYHQPLLVLNANNTWSMVTDLAISHPWGVQVLKNGSIYVTSNEGLYQIEDDGTQLIHELGDEFINETEAFNGKLLMNGHLKINQTPAYIFSYHETAFSLIADQPGHATFLRDNDDLFVRLGDNLYQYDGNNLNPINRQGYIIKIRNGEFYSIEQEMGEQIIVKEDASGKKKRLGNPFPSNIHISQICFLENIPVAIGTDVQLSVAYFFQDNKWHAIPTVSNLNHIIEYKGKILATLNKSPDVIIELTKQ